MQKFIMLKPVALVSGTINLPGSKSISNRALLLSSLANGNTTLSNLLDSDDVSYMLNALNLLGVKYVLSDDRRVCRIVGQGSPLRSLKQSELFLGNAGTAIRSLAASLCLGNNNIIVTGEPRMKERPIGHLVNALRQGGANIDYLEKENYPPLHIKGGFIGGKLVLEASISSQFLSALLMTAPLASNDTLITIQGEVVSKPYIDITLNMISRFGINIKNNNYISFFTYGKQQYQSIDRYLIEGDASSASYFLAAAAIKGGSVKVNGIGRNSMQGDIYFAKVLEKMGAKITWGDNFIICSRGDDLKAVDLDMNHIPDAAMTIAVVALFAKGTTVIRNIHNWRVKETDRLSAISKELSKVGAEIKEGNDFIAITPPSKIKYAEIETYNDHRMAMCFSLIAMSSVAVKILNPECTKKTFPDYFKQLATISHY